MASFKGHYSAYETSVYFTNPTHVLVLITLYNFMLEEAEKRKENKYI